jgi:hypothetical protein
MFDVFILLASYYENMHQDKCRLLYVPKNCRFSNTADDELIYDTIPD